MTGKARKPQRLLMKKNNKKKIKNGELWVSVLSEKDLAAKVLQAYCCRKIINNWVVMWLSVKQNLINNPEVIY